VIKLNKKGNITGQKKNNNIFIRFAQRGGRKKQSHKAVEQGYQQFAIIKRKAGLIKVYKSSAGLTAPEERTAAKNLP
jgi:hypothetical protein